MRRVIIYLATLLVWACSPQPGLAHVGGQPYPAGTPPPHVDYHFPTSAHVQVDYECNGRSLALNISSIGSRVRVQGYTGQVREADAEDLLQWNSWLSEIEEFRSAMILCGGSQNEAVIITGTGPNGGAVEVGVFWHEGRLGRLP